MISTPNYRLSIRISMAFLVMILLVQYLNATLLENNTLKVSFQGAQFSVLDKRNEKTWNTDIHPDIKTIGSGFSEEQKYCIEIDQTNVSFELDENFLTIEISSDTNQFFSVLPYPLLVPTSIEEEFFVMPTYCGILIPASGNIPHMVLPFPGHQYRVGNASGLNIPWFSITDMTAGCMILLDTPSDVVVELKNRGEDGIHGWVNWIPSLGKFGHNRRMKLIFLEEGGYVSMCKLYKTEAQKKGWFKTIQEKIKNKNGAEKFLNAPFLAASQFSGWGPESLRMGKELKQENIEKLMIFTFGSEAGTFSSDTIEELNKLGYAVIRYDCYGSIGPEEEFGQKHPRKLPFIQGHYPGWAVKLENQEPEVCIWQSRERGREDIYNLCSQFQAPWAKTYIPQELEEKAWLGLYIDTTTMQKLHECFDPDHTETRTDCIRGRSKLLEYVSSTGIITASEGGCFWAAQTVEGTFGILSLPPYFLPVREGDIEYRTPDMETFFGGLYCRVPLWELVYHDCTVSIFGKTDSNNRIKELWPYYDLVSILNGAVPTWVINAEIYERDKKGFVESYKRLMPHIKKISSVEMVAHRFLSEDRLVQETTFANGTTVTVNLSDKEYTTPSKITILPLDFYVTPTGEDTTDIHKENHNTASSNVFALFQNFPNPFNSTAIIKYKLLKPSHVSLIIYNTKGQLVRTLINESKPAGYDSVNWDGLNSSGKEVANGIYLYQLEAGEFIQTKRMCLLR